MPVWNKISDHGAGYFYNLSEALAGVEIRNPDFITPVCNGEMVVVSDYSGQHKEATHEAYSFLVTTGAALTEWMPLLSAFKAKWLPDGRRLSFKQLNEPVRRRALVPFLELSGALRGNLITVLVDRRVGSFMGGGAESIIRAFDDSLPDDTKHGTAEKIFRTAGFIAMIIAGLRREDQVSHWISDHDEALDSFARREQFSRIATYLTFGFTRWQSAATHHFGTTEMPQAPSWAEDAASIPDLVAGAYCKLSSFLPSTFKIQSVTQIVSTANLDCERSRIIGNWLALSRGVLKNILLRVELDETEEVRTSAQFFAGGTTRVDAFRDA